MNTVGIDAIRDYLRNVATISQLDEFDRIIRERRLALLLSTPEYRSISSSTNQAETIR